MHSLRQPPFPPLRRGLPFHRPLEALALQLLHFRRARILLPGLSGAVPAHLRQLLLLSHRHLSEHQPATQDPQGGQAHFPAGRQQTVQADREHNCDTG